MSEIYDLVVIGGGSGGVRAARMAATYGAKVAIIEEYRYGGTCVIRGCVPKKLFVYASRFESMFENAASFGWSVNAKFDWQTLLANKDKEITRLEGLYKTNLQRFDVETIEDRGLIEGPNQVRLVNADKVLDTKRILIATGGVPFKPNVAGAEFGITSNEALDFKTLPKSILIEGGGYIAVEFASIFLGLGVKVALAYRRDMVLRTFDDDIRSDLQEQLRHRGLDLHYQASITKLEKTKNGVLASFSNGETAEFGAVMFATGRTPNVKGLGLGKAGISLNSKGAIDVDDYAQTMCPSIYAVGDVTGRVQLTPVAIREGAAFVETIYNDNPTKIDYSLIPTAVFTEPEIGVIGMNEAQAASDHKDIDVYVARFRPMKNTLGKKTEKMLFKLITQKNGGRVLGCHILGEGAAEMIQLVAIPMAMGATKVDFDKAIAVHPSAAEELVTFKAPSYIYENGLKVE
jgi:glutathione reductase (NADPH)